MQSYKPSCYICGKNYDSTTAGTVLKDFPENGESRFVCFSCVSSDEDVILETLQAIDLKGFADDWCGSSSEQGYMSLIGRFLLFATDHSGWEYDEFRSAEDAARRYESLFADGMGVNEYDAFITDDRGGYAVSFDGKYLDTFETEHRARAAVSVAMRKENYFPRVWRVNDRGNVHLTEVW